MLFLSDGKYIVMGKNKCYYEIGFCLVSELEGYVMGIYNNSKYNDISYKTTLIITRIK